MTFIIKTVLSRTRSISKLNKYDLKYSKVVLKMTPRNYELSYLVIQKDIINTYTKQTTKVIIKELNGRFFVILADDISHKKQIAIYGRYIN